MKRKSTVIILLLAAVAGAFVWKGSPGQLETTAEAAVQGASSGSPKASLPKVGSFERFVSLMKNARPQGRYLYAADMSVSVAVSKEKAEMAVVDQSGTNIQVAGVDEADVIKTDGTYIYQLQHDKLIVTKVNPPEDMKVVWTKDFGAQNMYPREFFVDEKTLTIIADFRYPGTNYQITKIQVYELNDRNNMKLLRDAEVKGAYLSSRKIDNALYVVSNHFIHGYHTLETNRKTPKEFYLPSYRDSAAPVGKKVIPWDRISYFPHIQEPNYLVVAGLDVSDPSKQLSVSAYLGGGSDIYASKENLYVSTPRYETSRENKPEGKLIIGGPVQHTSIFKFTLNQGTAAYAGEGEVDGRLLNQFSMDEHNGYLRVATTTNGFRGNGANQSENHLFILDEGLRTVGEIRGIAPGESIYSVRFMSDRGYMVTFKKVDPLFVFDLKDPKKPKILGKLKIPGYSDYLHPYDENHIIGFGKDAVEAKEGDFAYYQGMKMALFDITDVNNPKEKFVEIIGDRGTDSELLRNHKALLFSKEKNVIAFPVTLMELPEGADKADGTAHGQFSFQGAYVFALDPERGFTLKSRISHLSDEDMLKSGYRPDARKSVERILYIGDNLYTVSQSMIQAHDMKRFNKIGDISLPD
ncbi:beta-propeller domain-containing protein [Paenibacillus alkalitolerans]|uniref:beta-propeller domain-containing protein n=1 Tax=Paenibacillus alkalitolerans TaxID=2799335 RepID=UPI0018F64717|nr:beta-propeller domain-containing protein [Paenibacillus alkalitolerans]